MSKKVVLLCLYLISAHFVSVSHAIEIRDYYAEPGINPFKQTLNQSNHEHIDPFSGTLQLTYTEILVPGNGGLDIAVNRVYTSLQTNQYPQFSPNGVGWTMHFGRIVTSKDHVDKVCSQHLWSVSTKDNPSLELSDGARELLVLNSINNDGSLITRSNWRATCKQNSDGFIVTSPDGVRYVMDQYGSFQGEPSWFTSRIEDLNGNWIQIDYGLNQAGIRYITEIYRSDVGSDRPVVTFEYDSATIHSSGIRVTAIEANGQRWRYSYEPVEGFLYPTYQLTEVIRPDGKSWQYSYNRLTRDTNPEDGVNEDGLGSYSLNAVTYPDGGRIEYTYQYVYFEPGSSYRTTSIATKTSYLGGSEEGRWTYEFFPSTDPDESDGVTLYRDVTRITTPTAIHVYYHYGKSHQISIGGTGTTYWYYRPSVVGLLDRTETRDLSNNVLEVTRNYWAYRTISNENYFHGGSGWVWWVDDVTDAPMLRAQRYTRDGITRGIDYSDHDEYGNPGNILEYANLQGDPHRRTRRTYFNDVTNWIIGKPITDEIIAVDQGTGSETSVGQIQRAYDPANGNLLSEERFGVLTEYTYTSEGDIASVTDPRGKVTRYSDYKRGIPRREDHPEQITILRNVNDAGTVASETNGRGFTTNFRYDSLNRLIGITYPINDPVSISYSANERRLSRGALRRTDTYDGFGRVISTRYLDVTLGESIATTVDYDSLSRPTFQSYPNSTQGSTTQYDALGRVTAIRNPDNSFKTYTYLDSQFTERDENGHPIIRLYGYYGTGKTSDKLRAIQTPANYTVISYDVLDNRTQVFQGLQTSDGRLQGFGRNFTYDSRFYLIRESHPDSADIHYTRDESGNMLTKRVGPDWDTTISYNYDDLGRLTSINYPDMTPDVTYVYDANGSLIHVGNDVATMDYNYDENDNLTSEIVTIAGHTYDLAYLRNSLDEIDRITYPSGSAVDYALDALGRPTRALPYVDSISYFPNGMTQEIRYANGQVATYDQTDRLQIGRIQVGSTASPIVDLSYGYDLAGNVSSIVNTLRPQFSRTMTYDAVDRLTTVVTGGTSTATYAYDDLNTIISRRVDGNVTTYQANGPRVGRVIHNPYLQDWISYDSHGRVTGILKTDDIFSVVYEDKQFFYDLADNLTSVTREASGAMYFNIFAYDANNMRVSARRDGHDSIIHYLYSSSQLLLGEYRGETASGKEHIYLGTQRVASIERNKVPVADAGSDQRVMAGQTVRLNGGGSYDTDGNIVSYAWSQTNGATVTLSGPNTVSPTFTAPNVDDTLTFKLTVSDDFGNTASDSVQITVSSTGNRPPVASAGDNQQVSEGAQVTLDGSASRDPDGTIASYVWTQLSGPAVTLSGATSAQATFTAPAVSEDTVLLFELKVTDDAGATGADTVEVIVKAAATNLPPVANAGADQVVEAGAQVSLDGSGSSDSDGSIVEYHWQQIAGPSVTLSDPSIVRPTFTAPSVVEDAVLQFMLTVTDNQGASASDAVQITVQNRAGDTEAPETSAAVTRYTSQGVALFDISLTTNEPATTYFRLTGDGRITAGGSDSADWQLYTSPVTVDLEVKGSGRPRPNPPSPNARIPDPARLGNSALGVFEFYSIDQSGNEEVVNREELR